MSGAERSAIESTDCCVGSTSAGIALWAAAVDRQADRELLNPPESARTYSGEGEASEAGALSVLGSKGEWKVVSHDQSRWFAIDLGSVRRVHAVVLQCGSLVHAFSGWVTRLKVAYSVEETPAEWLECREVLTGCGSDPMREHSAQLHAPVWARHVKLTPLEWKIAGVISSGESLELRVRVRVRVRMRVRVRLRHPGRVEDYPSDQLG